MKKGFIVLLCVVITFSAEAQFFRKSGWVGFFKMRNKPSYSFTKSPSFVVVQGADARQSFSYWQGSSYTTWSENGRIRTTYSFDVQGALRESSSSISLRKSGILSYWRIQFSPQRTRPFVTYTIH